MPYSIYGCRAHPLDSKIIRYAGYVISAICEERCHAAQVVLHEEDLVDAIAEYLELFEKAFKRKHSF